MTMLKFQDINVMEFDINKGRYTVHNENFMPFLMRNRIVDTRQINDKPLQQQLETVRANDRILQNFFDNRVLSINRTNAKKILITLNFVPSFTRQNTEHLIFLGKGLSVADDFWITNNRDEKWADVNLRENPLHEILARVALFGDTTLTVSGNVVSSPELTNQGTYPKAWFKKADGLYLYKGAKNDDAPRKEVAVSNILDCTNVPHVSYSLETIDNKAYSVCKNICSNEYSLVAAFEVTEWCKQTNTSAYQFFQKTDAENFNKMLIVDYLISNSDRHGKNWGFYMDSHTGELSGIHPLFDHNLAFDAYGMSKPDGGESRVLIKTSKQDAAMDAMNRCDFQTTSSISPRMFLEPCHYESFISRCQKLGLDANPKRRINREPQPAKHKQVGKHTVTNGETHTSDQSAMKYR